MNDDVPARDAEGRTSFYAEKSAQSLYAQLGSKHPKDGPRGDYGDAHAERASLPRGIRTRLPAPARRGQCAGRANAPGELGGPGGPGGPGVKQRVKL
jgi:hypothetical protein